MEHIINHSEIEQVEICETCHSENVRSNYDGMGYCEDCDAPCTIITVDVIDTAHDVNVADIGDYTRCCRCGIIIRIDEDTLGLVGDGWYCDMCE